MSGAVVTQQAGLESKYRPYPEYKDSGVEWLGEIPKHWQVVPIKYLAVLNPKKSSMDSAFLTKECTFVPMEKLKLNSIILDEKRLVRDVYGGYTYFEDGDVLMAKVTPCFENKNIAVASDLLNGIGFGSSEIYVIRATTYVNNRFLYYRLQEESFMDIATAAMTGAGGLKRVPSDVVNGYSLAAPVIEEQRTIAAFLDYETVRIDSLIDKQQRLVELLKEKRQAVISHAVTKGLNPNAPMKDSCVEWLGQVPEHWVVLPVKHISKSVGTGGTPKDEYSFSESADVCWFTPGDFSGELKLSVSKKHVTKLAVQNNDAKVYPAGSVLVIGIGATLGKVALCESEFSCNQQINVIQPNNKIEPSFLTYSLGIQTEQMKLLSNASTIGIMNQEKTKQVTLAIPPLEEQSDIARYLDDSSQRFARLLSSSESQIVLLQERRTALISAAVTGKIDVSDWTSPKEG